MVASWRRSTCCRVQWKPSDLPPHVHASPFRGMRALGITFPSPASLSGNGSRSSSPVWASDPALSMFHCAPGGRIAAHVVPGIRPDNGSLQVPLTGEPVVHIPLRMDQAASAPCIGATFPRVRDGLAGTYFSLHDVAHDRLCHQATSGWNVEYWSRRFDPGRWVEAGAGHSASTQDGACRAPGIRRADLRGNARSRRSRSTGKLRAAASQALDHDVTGHIARLYARPFLRRQASNAHPELGKSRGLP